MLQETLGGRYKIIKHFGGGGFGQTYLAEDSQLPGKPVCVVKQLKPQAKDPNTLNIARRLFDTEAQVLYGLGHHDQIPRLLAHFEENKEFYLVQEFIEGNDLSQELTQGKKWSEEKVFSLLQDVLTILEFVHSQSVIHRDIKPSNLIRRRKDNKIVLIDFGAVKQISTQLLNTQVSSNVTVSIGTRGYMPSEQSHGKPKLNSDIYALGIVAIQALTGIDPSCTPFLEDSQTGEISWRNQVRVSQRLANILETMVRYDFRQRYQSATEAFIALQNLNVSPSGRSQSSQPSKSRSGSNVKASTASQPSSSSTSVKNSTIIQEDEAKPVRKSKVKVFIFGSLFLMGLGGFLGIQFYRYLKPRLRPLIAILNSTESAPVVSPKVASPTPVVTQPSESPTADLPDSTVASPTPTASFSPTVVNSPPAVSPLIQNKTVISYNNIALANTLQGHSDQVNTVAISPDGETIVSGSRDGKIKIWNRLTGSVIITLSSVSDQSSASGINSVAISPNGQTLVSGQQDSTIKIWNLGTRKLIKTLSGHSGGVRSVAISPNGQTLASAASDKTIKIWNLASGQLISTLGGHSSSVNSVAISPDGQILASGSDDKTIKLWDLSTGELLSVLNGHSGSVSSLTFNPNGQSLASSVYNGEIKIWNLATRKELRSLNVPSGGFYYSVAFSPDGQTLASGSSDGGIQLWNPSTGKEINAITPSQQAYSITFSLDGRTMAASYDSAIQIWRVPQI